MGLTLHYQLRLPGTVSEEGIDHLLNQLRDHALTRGFAEVFPVVNLNHGLEARSPGEALAVFWSDAVSLSYPTDDGADAVRVADPTTIRAFFMNPGEGCEPASFGFLRRDSGWYWWCACKTQYASNHGEGNFLKCHLGLIALIDEAVRLGIAVEVHDEGEYWETRDESRLRKHVGNMNTLLARFGGELADRLGDEKVQAPIFEHPRFERLEMGETD